MPSYNNNKDKVNYIKATGSDIINNSYQLSISSLIDNSKIIGQSLLDSDEIIVVRKFDDSSISPSITAAETWSAWVLPNNTTSGSTMYTITNEAIKFSETAADYTWTTTMSGRAADVVLPALSASDTIYVIKRVHNPNKLVQWSAGSKITADNLNLESDQFILIAQELMTYFKKFEELNPAVGKPNGIVPLNSSGTIDSSYVDGSTLGIQTSNGVSGAGTTASPLTVNLDGDSLTQSSSGLKADVQDTLSSTSTTKPLSAKQGKELKDSVTSLGTGIVYKGAFDLKATNLSSSGIGTPTAGFTVGHSGTSGTALSDWNSLSVSNGTLIRYNGTAWQIASDNSPLLADGSVNLDSSATLNLTAGTATVATQSAGTNDTKAASTAFVQQEITGTNLSELNDVDANTDDATGNVIYWDGNSWAPKALESTTGSILTTNSDIADLGNVSSTSPTTNQVLQWNGSTWLPGTVSSTANEVYVAGADADGSADDATEVQAAFNDSNLGFETTSGSATLNVLNFRGRQHRLDSEITIPPKKKTTYLDGFLELNIGNAKDKYILKPGTETTKTTQLANDVYPGHDDINVDSSTGFAVGDLIRIIGQPGFAFNPSDTSSTNWYYARYHLTYIKKIIGNTLFLEEPLPDAFGTDDLVERAGEGTNGAKQMRDVKFKRMKFKDKLSQTIHTDSLSIGTTPVSCSSGSAAATINITGSSNAVSAGAYCLVQDADLGGSGTGVFVNDSISINGWRALTSSSTSSVGFNMAENSQRTASTGSNNVYITVSLNHGVSLRNASEIVFEDCEFEGFNGWAVLLENCKNVTFRNCVFKNCGGTNYVESTLNYVSSCIRLKGCDNINILNCKFNSCVSAIVCESNTATVNSDTQYVGCRNITIKDCTGSCTSFFMLKRCMIYDNLIIDNCNIEVFNPSVTRTVMQQSICTKTGVDGKNQIHGSYTHSAINLHFTPSTGTGQIGGAQKVSITNCNFGKMVDGGAEGYTAASYWATGDGYSRYDYSGLSNSSWNQTNNALPWANCVVLSLQGSNTANASDFQIPTKSTKQRYITNGNDLVFENNSCSASENCLYVYGWINVASTYMSGTYTRRALTGLQINNNFLNGIRGIVAGIQQLGINPIKVENIHIHSNTVYSYQAYNYIAGLPTIDTMSARNIHLRVISTEDTSSDRTQYYNTSIQNNQLICGTRPQNNDGGSQSSQNMLFGSSNGKKLQFYGMSVASNQIVGGKFGLYFYTESGGDRTNVTETHVVGNTFDSVEDKFRLDTEFLNDPTNKSSSNNTPV